MTEKVRNCDRCGKAFVEPYKEYLCRDCLDDLGWNATYHTNADRLRSMTDEELADILCVSCAFCACHPLDNCPSSCQAGVLAWLKRPYKETT